MSETRRESVVAATQSEMPWVSAWRYARQRAFAPRTLKYWAGSVVFIAIANRLFFDRSWLIAVGQAFVFVLGMEAIEFVRRFLSGAPVGDAGREEY